MMGMFDSFYDAGGDEWQTKALGCVLDRYNIGDMIPGPEVDYQIEVLGGPRDDPFQDGYATIHRGILAKLPAERDDSLPLVDYGGTWTSQGEKRPRATSDELADLLKAERSAADLAYYFGSDDLREKYEAAQAAVDVAVQRLQWEG